MWIKICGNTNLEDCQRAADLGANAVGFVFAPGKRTVTAGQVAAITAKLSSPLEKIGVFTTGSFDEIFTAANDAGLTGVQLHGAVAMPLLDRLRTALGTDRQRRTVLQVLHWFTDVSAAQQQQSFAAQAEDIVQNGSADAVLIDSRTESASGGMGKVFDWEAAGPTVRRIPLPVIAAGGLNPQNVSRAIATLSPWGVDVASGVEAAPGRKDPELLARFIHAARNA